MTRQALGKGLEALLPGTGTAPKRLDEEAGPVEVPIASIGVNPAQPRHAFRAETLAGLAESIRRYGILQPLLVRRTEGGYELIAGERRLRAAGAAGLTTVPVVVRGGDEQARMELALVENLQREDLTPLEEAAAYRRLIDEFGLTQEAIADRVGKSRPSVANSLRLLGLPDPVKALLDSRALSAGHARAVLSVEGRDAQVQFARDLVQRQVPKTEAERLARAKRPGTARARGGTASARQDPNLRAVADRLTRSLGTRVRVQPKRKGGSIQIEYYSNAELERLIGRLVGDE
jgi:ParB family chromosome partitioning protein